jgi:hypothetical protein
MKNIVIALGMLFSCIKAPCVVTVYINTCNESGSSCASSNGLDRTVYSGLARGFLNPQNPTTTPTIPVPEISAITSAETIKTEIQTKFNAIYNEHVGCLALLSEDLPLKAAVEQYIQKVIDLKKQEGIFTAWTEEPVDRYQKRLEIVEMQVEKLNPLFDLIKERKFTEIRLYLYNHASESIGKALQATKEIISKNNLDISLIEERNAMLTIINILKKKIATSCKEYCKKYRLCLSKNAASKQIWTATKSLEQLIKNFSVLDELHQKLLLNSVSLSDTQKVRNKLDAIKDNIEFQGKPDIRHQPLSETHSLADAKKASIMAQQIIQTTY